MAQANKKRYFPKAKKKQLIVIGVALVAVFAIAGVATNYKNNLKKEREEKKEQTAQKKVTATDFSRPDQMTNESDLWKNTEGAKLEQQSRKIEDMERKMDLLIRGKNKTDVSGTDLPGDDVFGNGTVPPPPPAGNVALPSGKDGLKTTTEPPRSSIQSVDIPLTPSPTATQQVNARGEVKGPYVRRSDDFKKSPDTVRIKGVRPNIEVYQDGGDFSVSVGKFRARESYIPAGTFFRVVLLGGVDAPTGGDAQNANPHPILMRVSDMAQLPNLFKYNFKECFITASAYGDISSERAYARTDRLSCVGQDGKVLEVPIKGYLAGEDGKTGVRGTIVTKQGQIIANALLAGVISGAGKGIADSYKSTSTSVFGTTSSTKGGDEYKAGIASGMGSAMDRIADYYIKLADKTFPVVEINAGRKLDVVLIQGFQIDISEQK